MKNVGIFIFNDAEVLDFAGPFEVFSVASEIHDHSLFNTFTVAKTKDSVTAINGLSVNPAYSIVDCPNLDILIIAGGNGTRALVEDREVMSWLDLSIKDADITMTICSAARVLGVLGLLDGNMFCTHHQVYDHMAQIVPKAIARPELRFIQSSKNVYTSGSISAGIDLSFHVLEQITSASVADATAEYMEYRRVKPEDHV